MKHHLKYDGRRHLFDIFDMYFFTCRTCNLNWTFFAPTVINLITGLPARHGDEDVNTMWHVGPCSGIKEVVFDGDDE